MFGIFRYQNFIIPLFEKLSILWGSWIRLPVPVGDIFWGVASGCHEIIAVRIYIEQCIDMSSVLKVNYKVNSATLFEVWLVFFIVKFRHLCHMNLVWFDLFVWPNKALIASFPDGVKSISWNIAVLNWELLCRKLLGW